MPKKEADLMPRPCKARRICAMPGCRRFGPTEPCAEGESVTMALDEYETIRLIDLEGLTQEDSAERMDVARTTVQAVYTSARKKLAECLVHGRELRIEGGNCVVCDGDAPCCGHCHKGCCRGQKER